MSLVRIKRQIYADSLYSVIRQVPELEENIINTLDCSIDTYYEDDQDIVADIDILQDTFTQENSYWDAWLEDDEDSTIVVTEYELITSFT